MCEGEYLKSKHMFLFAGDIYDIMKKKTSYSLARTKLEERKKWVTHDEMMNVTVIAESTPGPIAINCATFTGYKKAGFAWYETMCCWHCIGYGHLYDLFKLFWKSISSQSKCAGGNCDYTFIAFYVCL